MNIASSLPFATRILSLRRVAVALLALLVASFAVQPVHAQAPSDMTAPAAPQAVPEDDDQDSTSTEIRRGVRMGGEGGKRREQVVYERLIGRVEPSLKGNPEHLRQYIQLFESELINDTRLFATDVDAAAEEDGTIRLSGHVMFEENRTSLGKLFQYLGFEKVQNDVEVLPSADLGEKQFAFVKAPGAFSYDKTEKPRETLTQGLLGDPVFLLKKAENGHVLATTGDGYIGYIAESDLHVVTREEFAAYQGGAQLVVKQDVKVGDQLIPAGARLKSGGDADAMNARGIMPDGTAVTLPAAAVEVFAEGTPAAVKAALDIAHAKLGSDYVWGGKTSQGVDCSGLVQSSYKALGLYIPRDTYMQAYVGNLVATRWYPEGMREGDLMFFLGGNGKIHHVAMYLKDGQFIESAGEVKISSLNPGDKNYDEKRAKSFCFAKRLMQ